MVEKTKALVLAQAKANGFPVTSNPDLHIVADGQRIDAMPLGDSRYLFVIPAERGTIALRSRVFAPCETVAFSGDRRLLGVNVTRLQIDGDDLPLDSALASGWHGLERNKQGLFRWTDGATPLPA